MTEIKSSLVNSKGYKYIKENILALDPIDGETNFRVDLVEYINDSADGEDDEFFWEMLEFLRFLDPIKYRDYIAFTTPDTMVYLNAPSGGPVNIGKNMRQWDFTYDHECLHQLWETFEVENRIKREGKPFNPDVLNVASDCVINDYLRYFRKKEPPKDIVFPETLEEKFGVQYDRKKDTQYTLYLKLMRTGKEDQIAKLNDFNGKIKPGKTTTVKMPDMPSMPDMPDLIYPKEYVRGWKNAIQDVLDKKVDPTKYQPAKTWLDKLADHMDKLKSGDVKNFTYEDGYNDAMLKIAEGVKNGITLIDSDSNQNSGQRTNLPEIPWEKPEKDNKNTPPAGGGKSRKDFDGMKGEEAANDARESAEKAKDAAQKAQDKADKSGKKSDQAAADRAKEAAKKAQEAADKANKAAENNDQKGAQEGAKAADEAAQQAEDTANGNGQANIDDMDGAEAKDDAKESAEKAQAAADKAKEAAKNAKDKAKETGKLEDSAKARRAEKAAEKAQEAADKAKEAAEAAENAAAKGNSDAAKEKAKEARKQSEEAQDKSVEAQSEAPGDNKDNAGEDNSGSNNNPPSDMKPSWSYDPFAKYPESEKTDVDIRRLVEKKKQVIKKYSERISGDFGSFIAKCKASMKLKDSGLAGNTTNKGVSGWNTELHHYVNLYVKNRIFKQKRQYEKTYKRVKRGSGFIKWGDPIKPDRRVKEDKFTINIAFYVDRSGSMDNCINKVFDACYFIAEAIKKTFSRDKIVDSITFKIFGFNDSMEPIPYGKKVHATGGTMGFHQILKYIKEKTSDFMINIIITDAGFEINKGQINDFLKELDGMFIFVPNTISREMKQIAKENKTQLYYVQADTNFTIAKDKPTGDTGDLEDD